MKRWRLVAGVSVLAIIVVAGAYAANVFPAEIAPLAAVDRDGFSDDRIEAGENLAKIGDCSTCHTPRGSRAMQGGVGLPTPFGTIYSTNITPDPETGIGTWSYAAFERAMREGIARDGTHLYPAFPYDHFAGMTDEDLLAVYEYLMVQDPVVAPAVANELSFPFSLRPLLAGWKLLFHRPAPFAPNPEFNDEENRGAYLAETVGHCAACHSPRNALGAVRASAHLGGGEAEGWLIPPLGAASISPVAWDLDDYADYLFDGWSEYHSIAAGPMTPVVDNLYEAEEDDVYAIAAWLARITPPQDEAEREARIAEVAARDLPESFDPALPGQDVSDEIRRGAQVFKDGCLRCHKERIADSQPVSLGLTYAVNAHAPTNLMNAVVHGIQPPIGSATRRMEAVTLSEPDLAAVAAFVRWQFTDLPAWENLPAQAATAKAAPAH